MTARPAQPAQDILDQDAELAFLYDRIDYERTNQVPYRLRGFTLERMSELLRRLGNPHQGLKIIHFAGTKGKGSTAAMISSVLTQAGYRTALYTSPHLERLEERLMINGVACSRSELVALLHRVRPIVEAMDRQAMGSGLHPSGPTYFEIITAMALLHFAQQAVDATVLEVGLGGRLDSTNVCQPLVSVITSISFDHMRQLGTTLGAIAAEKAGIIKCAAPVVSGVTQAEPRQVIEQIAQQHGCRLYSLNEHFRFNYRPPAAERTASTGSALNEGRLMAEMSYHEKVGEVEVRWDELSLGLLGSHQAANAAVALATVGRLQQMGWQVPETALRRGLAEVRWPARVEVVRQQPTVLVDTAHNVASIEALLTVIHESFPSARRLLIFATSRDKDLPGMLRQLLPCFEHVIFTRYLNNPRYVTPEELAQLANQVLATWAEPTSRPSVSVCADPASAWRQAQCRTSPEHLICITGSFFLAAEMRQLLRVAGSG